MADAGPGIFDPSLFSDQSKDTTSAPGVSGIFSEWKDDEAQAPGVPVPKAVIGNASGKPMSTAELSKTLPVESPEEAKEFAALGAQIASRPRAETLGAIPTFAGSMANMGAFGITPYVAAALPGGELGNLPFNERVKYYKSAQSAAEREHPTASWLGTGAGLLAGLPFGGPEAKAASTAVQGAGYGLTQGGSGLEDFLSGKADVSAPLTQAAIGAGEGLLAHGLMSKVNPTNVRDAASYAYNLGVPLASGIMNAGKKGFEYLAPKAEQTLSAISQRFNQLTGGMTPTEAGEAMVQALPSLKSAFFPSSGYVHPDEIFTTLRDMTTHAQGALNLSTIKNALGANSPEWEAFQNGVLNHLGGEKSFSFNNFMERLGNMHPDAKKLILEGRDDAVSFLDNLTGLANSTTSREGNAIDRAVAPNQYIRQAPSSTVGQLADLTRKALKNPATYIGGAAKFFGGLSPLAALGIAGGVLGTQKAASIASKALGSRNAALSPAVRGIVDQGTSAARRGITSALTTATSGIPQYTHSGLQNFAKTVMTPDAAKWYSAHMPWVLGGGKSAGGRAAYKSGGKVGTKDIEPLISALMNKARQAKKVSNKATEPLLNAKDDAIASALAVAQKAI